MSLVVHCVTSTGGRAKVECGVRVSSENNPTALSTGRDMREHAELFGVNVLNRFLYVVTDGSLAMTGIWRDRFPGECIITCSDVIYSDDTDNLSTNLQCIVHGVHNAFSNAWNGACAEDESINSLATATTDLAKNVNDTTMTIKIRQECETCWMSRYLMMQDINSVLLLSMYQLMYYADNYDRLVDAYQTDEFMRHERLVHAIDKRLLQQVSDLLTPIYKRESRGTYHCRH